MEASAWYGKPPGPRSCKKAACRRALGLGPALQGRKRGRSAGTGSADDEEEDTAGQLYLHELEEIYGSRFCCFACAPSTHHSLIFFPCSYNLCSHVRSCPLRVLALPAQALQPPQDVFT